MGGKGMQRRYSAVGGPVLRLDLPAAAERRPGRKGMQTMQVKGGFQRQARHSVACTDFWEVEKFLPYLGTPLPPMGDGAGGSEIMNEMTAAACPSEQSPFLFLFFLQSNPSAFSANQRINEPSIEPRRPRPETILCASRRHGRGAT